MCGYYIKIKQVFSVSLFCFGLSGWEESRQDGICGSWLRLVTGSLSPATGVLAKSGRAPFEVWVVTQLSSESPAACSARAATQASNATPRALALTWAALTDLLIPFPHFKIRRRKNTHMLQPGFSYFLLRVCVCKLLVCSDGLGAKYN